MFKKRFLFITWISSFYLYEGGGFHFWRRKCDMKHDPDCLFCKIVRGEIPSFKIYENDRALAFADIAPLNPGHSLVIPRSHSENLYDIPPEDLAAVHEAAKKVALALKSVLKQPGLTIIQLNGRGANQVIMHYHVHLVPRDRATDGLNMLDWESKPGDMEEIKALAEKIAAAVKG
jgi:histidine triad (HIT) family protein